MPIPQTGGIGIPALMGIEIEGLRWITQRTPLKRKLPLQNIHANLSERNIKMGGELEKDLKPKRISKIIDNFASEYTNKTIT